MSNQMSQSIPALTTDDILGNLSIETFDSLTGNLLYDPFSNYGGAITGSSSGILNLGNIGSTFWSSTQNSTMYSNAVSIPKVNLDQNGISMAQECDIKIGEFSLKDSLERIEKQLAILHVNPELEKEWEELKELGDRYRELEKNIHDKMKVWKILKND